MEVGEGRTRGLAPQGSSLRLYVICGVAEGGKNRTHRAEAMGQKSLSLSREVWPPISMGSRSSTCSQSSLLRAKRPWVF